MLNLVISIALGADAIQTPADAQHAIVDSLHAVASWFTPFEGGQGGAIRDANGNTVGEWKVTSG